MDLQGQIARRQRASLFTNLDEQPVQNTFCGPLLAAAMLETGCTVDPRFEHYITYLANPTQLLGTTAAGRHPWESNP
jgi:hypothetical protein